MQKKKKKDPYAIGDSEDPDKTDQNILLPTYIISVLFLSNREGPDQTALVRACAVRIR